MVDFQGLCSDKARARLAAIDAVTERLFNDRAMDRLPLQTWSRLLEGMTCCATLTTQAMSKKARQALSTSDTKQLAAIGAALVQMTVLIIRQPSLSSAVTKHTWSHLIAVLRSSSVTAKALSVHYASAVANLCESRLSRVHLTPNLWNDIMICIIDKLDDLQDRSMDNPTNAFVHDRSPESVSLSNALACLVASNCSLIHVSLLDSDQDSFASPQSQQNTAPSTYAKCILSLITRYLSSFQVESITSVCLVATALLVILEMDVDSLVDSMDSLDDLIPNLFSLCECRSSHLKAYLLNIFRLYILLTQVHSREYPSVRKCFYRIAQAICPSLHSKSSLPSNLAPMLAAIVRKAPEDYVLLSLKHSQDASLDVSCLKIDIASSLLLWQLEYPDMLESEASTCSSPSRTGDQDTPSVAPRKRLKRSTINFEERIDASFADTSSNKDCAWYFAVLALASSRNWELCKHIVLRNVSNLLKILAASNTASLEETILLLSLVALDKAGDVCEMQSVCDEMFSDATMRLSRSTRPLAEVRMSILHTIINRKLVSEEHWTKWQHEWFTSSVGDFIGSEASLALIRTTNSEFRESKASVQVFCNNILEGFLAFVISKSPDISSRQLEIVALSLLSPTMGSESCHTMSQLTDDFPRNMAICERMIASLKSRLTTCRLNDVTISRLFNPDEPKRNGNSVSPTARPELVEIIFRCVLGILKDAISKLANLKGSSHIVAVISVVVVVCRVLRELSSAPDTVIRTLCLEMEHEISILNYLTRIVLDHVNMYGRTQDSKHSGELMRIADSISIFENSSSSNHVFWPLDVSVSTHFVAAISNCTFEAKDYKATRKSNPMNDLDDDEMLDNTTAQRNSHVARNRLNNIGSTHIFEIYEYGDVVPDNPESLASLSNINRVIANGIASSQINNHVRTDIYTFTMSLLNRDDLIFTRGVTTKWFKTLIRLFDSSFISRLVSKLVLMHDSPGYINSSLFVMHAIELMSIWVPSILAIRKDALTSRDYSDLTRDVRVLFDLFASKAVPTQNKQFNCRRVKKAYNELLTAVMTTECDGDILEYVDPAGKAIELLQNSQIAFKLDWALNTCKVLFDAIEPSQYSLLASEIIKHMPVRVTNSSELVACSIVWFSVVTSSCLLCVSALASLLNLVDEEHADVFHECFYQFYRHLGFESSKRFLDATLPFILNECDKFEKFAWFTLPGVESLASLAAENLRVVASKLIKDGRFNSLEKILVDKSYIIPDNFGVIYGVQLPLTFIDPYSGRASRSIHELLEICHITEPIKEQIRHASVIVNEILIFASGFEQQLPNYSFEAFRHLFNPDDFLAMAPWCLGNEAEFVLPIACNVEPTLKALAAFFHNIKAQKVSDLFKPTRLQKLLFGFQRKIRNLQIGIYRRHFITNGYRLLMALAQDHILNPFIFRSCLNDMLSYVTDEATLGACCPIILHLVSKTCLSNAYSNLLDNFVSIISTLICAFNQFRHRKSMWANTTSLSTSKSIASVIQSILELAQAHNTNMVRSVVQMFDFGDDLFDEVAKKYEISGLTMDDIVGSLLESNIQTTAPLKYVQDLLRHADKVGLVVETHGVCLHKKLADILCFSRIDDIRVEATKCIVQLEALMNQDANITSEGSQSIDNEKIDARYEGHLVAMHLVCEGLFNKDLDVAFCASKTLSALACTEDGQRVIRFLDKRYETYVALFKSRRTSNDIEEGANSIQFDAEVFESVFYIDDGIDTSGWCVRIAKCLLQMFDAGPFFAKLSKIVSSCSSFADAMIPYIVHSILEQAKTSDLSTKPELSNCINNFLRNATKSDAFSIGKVLQTLKLLCKISAQEQSVAYHWLDLEIDALVKAAILIDSLDALYLIEFYTDSISLKHQSQQNDSIWKNLVECYDALKEPDGFDGALTQINNVSDDVLLRKYRHNGTWNTMIANQDAVLQTKGHAGSMVSVTKPDGLFEECHLIEAMSASGQYHTLNMYIQGLERVFVNRLTESVREYQFESLWRLGMWDSAITSKTNGTESLFFRCLSAINQSIASPHTRSVVEQCITGMFGCKHEFPIQICFIEMQEMVDVVCGKSKSLEVLRLWSARVDAIKERRTFTEFERLLATRTVLLQAAYQFQSGCERRVSSVGGADKTDSVVTIHDLAQHLVQVANLANQSGTLNTARLAISNFDKLDHDLLSMDEKHQMKVQYAKMLWKDGQHSYAIGILEDVFDQYKKPNAQHQKKVKESFFEADVACTLGMWYAESQTSNPKSIIEKYFVASTDVLNSLHDAPGRIIGEYSKSELNSRSSAYYCLANYCDEILQRMLTDETHKQFMGVLKEREIELQECMKILQTMPKSESKQLGRFAKKLEMQIELDRIEASHYDQEIEYYLHLGVENYAKALIYSSERIEECVFRLCSLWFSNAANKDLQALMRRYINQLPTRKFLILMYQISARMLSSNKPEEALFNEILEQLIVNIVTDYPHHSLPHIIALYNGSETSIDEGQQQESKTRGTSSASEAAKVSAKSQAIQKIVKRLARDEELRLIVTNVDYMFKTYIQVANLSIRADPKKKGDTAYRFDRKMAIVQFEANTKVGVITREQPAEKPRDYSNIVYVEGFDSDYKLPGGINVPKVVECRGSDGNKYRQLVKGNDDLRQDAVLSSIFNMVNVLLRKQATSRKRGLCIRTYSIIPLSPRAGVVQWVDGTILIGKLLSDGHKRYNEKDWTMTDCRKRMQEEYTKASSTPKAKLNAFEQIQSNFHPVLSRMLFEMYTERSVWFENRKRFTRSVATSSMAGYVVGLGDRHAQNVLFDMQTAEVIHIDLGIAFDQGKLLTVPELVPFRLTQDIVDGMGMTGCDGYFRRGCQEAMHVLRSEKHAILTLLDVFRHDPLYSWSISPLKKSKLQNSETVERDGDKTTASAEYSSNQVIVTRKSRRSATTPNGGKHETRTNDEAERAIFAVRKKLSSTESVECQVSQLISSATDSSLLSRMFPGWQPWL